MAVGLDEEGRPVDRAAPAFVILLDTNTLIWLAQNRPRVRALARGPRRLYISPANLVELQFLVEAGRIRLRAAGVSAIAEDSRWVLDDLPAAAWFANAIDLSWTRDPFDWLLAAHARLRGWRLATGDTVLPEPAARRRSHRGVTGASLC